MWREKPPVGVGDWISRLWKQVKDDVRAEIKITLNPINPVRSQIDLAGLAKPPLQIFLVLIEENINNRSLLEWTTESIGREMTVYT